MDMKLSNNVRLWALRVEGILILIQSQMPYHISQKKQKTQAQTACALFIIYELINLLFLY